MFFLKRLNTILQPGKFSLLSKKLLLFQSIGFLILIFQVFLIVSCFNTLLEQPHLKTSYIYQLIVILLLFHLSPVFYKKLNGKGTKVRTNGNSWRIGNYSEKEMKDLIEEATQNLPNKLRNIQVNIDRSRSTSAWTISSFIWPNKLLPKSISISRGALYYLNKNELKAVLLHELAHNIPRYRVNPFGGLLLSDIVIHCGLFIFTYDIISFFTILFYFTVIRSLIYRVVFSLICNVSKEIEYMCDYFAATILGKAHIINALLKMGEEEELTDAVISLSAKRLTNCESLELIDLYYAFEEVRPYGRIFHDNLFKHVAAVVSHVSEENSEGKTSSGVNNEFLVYLENRRQMRKNRVRWRSFDKQKKGYLSSEEIKELCCELTNFPNKILVMSENEFYPTTHPKFRDRIMVVNDAIIN